MLLLLNQVWIFAQRVVHDALAAYRNTYGKDDFKEFIIADSSLIAKRSKSEARDSESGANSDDAFQFPKKPQQNVCDGTTQQQCLSEIHTMCF